MRVVAAVVEDSEGRVLLAQRPPGKAHAGRWEFPGGKVEPGETGVDALRRELFEELGLTVLRAARFMRVRRPRPGGVLELEAWRVVASDGVPRAHEHGALTWLHPHQALSLPLCEADVPICRALDLPAAYAITPEFVGNDVESWIARIELGLRSGVRMVQLRVAGLDPPRFASLARDLLDLARPMAVRVLVNSDAETAIAVGADGVHLKSSRLMRLETLPERPAGFLVAASCHNADEILHAARVGADFIVVSPVNATPSHPHATPLGWEGFRRLLECSDVPAYALGGLQTEGIALAREQGALGIAGISAFW